MGNSYLYFADITVLAKCVIFLWTSARGCFQHPHVAHAEGTQDGDPGEAEEGEREEWLRTYC